MCTYTYIYFIVRKGGSDPPLSGPHLLTQLVPLPIFKMFFPSPLFCSSLFKDILVQTIPPKYFQRHIYLLLNYSNITYFLTLSPHHKVISGIMKPSTKRVCPQAVLMWLFIQRLIASSQVYKRLHCCHLFNDWCKYFHHRQQGFSITRSIIIILTTVFYQST